MTATAQRTGTFSKAELLAAGTDLMERRRSGVSHGPIAEITRTDENTRISSAADGWTIIGSLVTIAAVASDSRLTALYPGLSAAAAALATPQIRAFGTIGGNLAQHSRCWYYRNPHMACLKKGGDICPARNGNHLYGVIFDIGPCVAPHPSTLGAALLAYDATVTTDRHSRTSIGAVFGDGTDGTRHNDLEAEELIVSIDLPSPVDGERAAYRRAISRTYAEWPLVEVIVRVALNGDRISLARISAGGVAPVPIRLRTAESVLLGKRFDPAVIALAAKSATADAKPLPLTGYKIPLLEGLVASMLEEMGT
jgi:xanthine dehydrogenase YagS FAD-binding subunit